MKESYIQAIILGLLIGGAIILDDFIRPKPKKFADRVFMEHKGKNSITQMKKYGKTTRVRSMTSKKSF